MLIGVGNKAITNMNIPLFRFMIIGGVLLFSVILYIYTANITSAFWNEISQAYPKSLMTSRDIHLEEDPSKPIQRDQWIKIHGRQTWIYSAYNDNRSNIGKTTVHVLGFSFYADTKPAFCYFFNPSSANSSRSLSVLSKREFLNPYAHNYDKSKIPFWATSYDCDIPKNVQFDTGMHVTIRGPGLNPTTGEGIVFRQNTDKDQSGGDFVVCISPLHGELEAATLVEMMELNLLFGANLIAIYDLHIHSGLDKVIGMYKNTGKLEIIPWHMPKKVVVKTHYFGQNLAINDCLYRYMARYRYIIITDLDEVITPLQHKTWGNMMRHLLSKDERASNFVFRHIRWLYEKNDTHSMENLRVGRIFAKQVVPDSRGIRSKMVLVSSRVLSVGVHTVFRSIYPYHTKVVAPSVGVLSHFTPARKKADPPTGMQLSTWEMDKDINKHFKNRMDILQV